MYEVMQTMHAIVFASYNTGSGNMSRSGEIFLTLWDVLINQICPSRTSLIPRPTSANGCWELSAHSLPFYCVTACDGHMWNAFIKHTSPMVKLKVHEGHCAFFAAPVKQGRVDTICLPYCAVVNYCVAFLGLSGPEL